MSAAGIGRPGTTSGGAMAAASDAGGRGGEPLGVEEGRAVGAVEEDRWSVVTDGSPRLDEEVGPLGIVDRSRAPPPGPRRRRPVSGSPAEGVAPSTGRDPRRRRAAAWTTPRALVAKSAGASGPGRGRGGPAAAPEVEAVAAMAGHGTKRAGDAWEAHDLPDGQRALRAELAGTGHRVHEMAGQRQQDRRREAVLGQFDGGGQDVVEGQPPVAIVQRVGQPSTAPGTGTLRMSPRTGIVAMPSRRSRAGRMPRGPAAERSASGVDPGGATMASTSPPSRQVGPTTAIAVPVATAASAAEPPCASMPSPAEAASWSAAATMPAPAHARTERGKREGHASGIARSRSAPNTVWRDPRLQEVPPWPPRRKRRRPV